MRCNICGNSIVKKEDLVVTNRFFFKFGIYHKECFNKAFNDGTEYVGRPINTPAANTALAIILLIALVAYVFLREPLLLLVLILSPLYRFYVWNRWEKILE